MRGDRKVFLLLGLLSSLLIFAAYRFEPAFLTALDLRAADAMFKARGDSPPPSEVVIVAIDERSVNEGGRWPWPRKKTASLIRSLKGAKVLALDMVFSEEEGPEADAELSNAIKDAGNVVAGFFFRDDSTEAPKQESLDKIKGSKISLLSSTDESFEPQDGLFTAIEFSGIEANIPIVGEGAAGSGSFNIIPQYDGIYRSSGLVFRYGGVTYPSLALEAVRKYMEGDAVIYLAPYGIDGISVGERFIPVGEDGAVSLNFYGKGGSFKTYSAIDVLEGRVDEGEFDGKLVFVGVTEKAIYDIRPTPVDNLFPGVEIQATVAGNILEDRYIIHDTGVVLFDLAMVFLIPAVLAVTLSSIRSTFVSLSVMAGLMTLLIIGDFYLFSAYSVRAGVIYPALSLAAAYLSMEAYRNLVVERKSKYIKKAFTTYVSHQLVSEILKNPDKLKLGGEKRVVTVLFSDIRGFTTLSEELSPEGLVKLLNEYLSPMTRIVLDEEGMLDKYIGDAIMAVFNAPVEIDAHPLRACGAALKMMERLRELNVKWKAGGYPELSIGIGINTGEAVVGNMGAELRFDYTAIGDTVNLASRLEGMNKMYGTSVIVSEFTYGSVKDGFLFRELDYVRVKGKMKPINIYELIGFMPEDRDEVPEKIMALTSDFERALGLYREGRFLESGKVFEGILERFPEDGPSKLYVKRCAEYLITPPPPDWDGVFVAKSK